MFRAFRGGVRPAAQKKNTRRLSPVALDHPPALVVLPLEWCCAVPRVLVKEGDRVRLGQKLAEPTGKGVPLHASVSGRVLSIEERPFRGGRGLAVILENDGQNTPVDREEPLPRKDRPDLLSPAEILKAVRECGVVDMDRTCAPTYARLREAEGKVDTLILNAVECEPYVTSTHRLLLERTEEILGGIRLLMRVLDLKEATLAIGSDKGDAIAAFQKALPLRGGDIRVITTPVRYPQGEPWALAQRVKHHRMSPGGPTLDVGCLVIPAATAAAVYDAVYLRKPLTSRLVTVAGGALGKPGNYTLPLGARIGDVLQEAGRKGRPARVVLGGAMTGEAITDLTMPIGKGEEAVLALSERECAGDGEESGSCVRCGRCVDVCPAGLEPYLLGACSDAGKTEMLEKLDGARCLECGACTYVCPSRIRQLESIRRGKAALREWREEGRA